MGKPTGFLEYERETGCVISPEERIQNFNEFHIPLSSEMQQKQGARLSLIHICNVSSIDTYLDTSTFCFELFGMSQERQLKKLQAVFWPADKLNRSWYPFFTTLKLSLIHI